MVRRISNIDILDQTSAVIGPNPAISVIEDDVMAYLNVIRRRGAIYDACARRNTVNPSRSYMNKFRDHGNKYSINRAFRVMKDAPTKNAIIDFLLGENILYRQLSLLLHYLGAGKYEPYHRHSAEERTEYEEKCGVVNGHEVIIKLYIEHRNKHYYLGSLY